MNKKAFNNTADIVFFVPNLDGGVGNVVVKLANEMHVQGKTVAIWTATQIGEYEPQLLRDISVHKLGTGSVRSALINLKQALRTQKPRSLISISFHANCAVLLATMLTNQRPHIVISEHTSLDIAFSELNFIKRVLWRTLVRALYSRADTYVAVSKGVAKAMSKYGGLDMPKIKIISNPVISEEIFAKSKKPVKHPFFNNNESVLVFIGRLTKEKDLPNLLHAFELIQSRIKSKLLIIGDGPEYNKLNKIVARKHLAECVAFLGHKTNPYPYLLKSDLLVLSSKREGLPTVIIEALALGIKVVSTDCPSGPREILKNGTYGTLVPVGQSQALADGIIKTLDAKKKTIPQEVLSTYKVDSATESYLKLLS